MASTINASNSGSGGIVQTADASGVLQLQSAGTTAVTIDTSQNVGIGTTSPSYKLDAISTGGTQTARFRSGDTATTVDIASFERSDSAVRAVINYNSSDGAMTYGTSTNHPIAFKTNNAERMRIDSSGKVFVGTTTNANNGAMIVQQAANGTGITVNGVNNTSGAVFMYFTEAGANCGYIQRVGTTGAVVYATSSDYRLKENIAPITGALAKVAQLKPVTYDWKSGGSSQGFIAHELQEVIPDAVTGIKDQLNEDGSINAQGIDQSRIVATLTAAIQELKAINDTQAETINALTARIVALEAK